MTEQPPCSVLICTRDRAPLLRTVLESLCRQGLDPRRFETVVVEDGSTDDTGAVVESYRDRLRLRHERQRPAGLAAARNHALFLASGPIVIWQDDDDAASAHLVEEHLRAHEAHPEDGFAVLGRTTIDPRLRIDPVMHFTTEVEQYLFAYPGLEDGQVLGFEHFWGGRSSCKRRFLLEHGIFDPRFQFGCEDIELAARLRAFGLRVVYRARAVTTMLRAFSFDAFCERLVRQGRSTWTFSRLHRDDAEVQRWAGVEGAIEAWDAVAPVYEDVMRTARALDRTVRVRLGLGLPGHRERALAYEAYAAAFRASKLKGVAEQARAGGAP